MGGTSNEGQKLQLGKQKLFLSCRCPVLAVRTNGRKEIPVILAFVWSLPDLWKVLIIILTKLVEDLELEKYLSGKLLFSKFHSFICLEGYYSQHLISY